MMIFTMQKIKQSYGATTVFHEASLELLEGDAVGIVGNNGGGKTTLLRIMAKEIKPEKGETAWKKGAKIGFLHQLPVFDGESKVYSILQKPFARLHEISRLMRELETQMQCEFTERAMNRHGNLLEEFQKKGGYEMDTKISRVANGLGVSELLQQKWGSLSGGERTKIGLALILLEDPDLLLLDEPTNHLDLPAIEWLTDYIKGYKKTLVIVSHDRYFLDDTVKKIVEIDQGEISLYYTNYTGYLKEREERILREFQQYQDQQKKIKKMKEAIKRLKEWANRSDNAKLHRRAKSMEKALARIQLLEKPAKEKDLSFQLQKADRSGDRVIMLKDVGHGFSSEPLFSNVNLEIRQGDRVAFAGENGSGKTTLLKIIMKELLPDSGEVKTGTALSVGYLSQCP